MRPQLHEGKGHSPIKTAYMCTSNLTSVLSHADKWQCQMLDNMPAWDGWAFWNVYPSIGWPMSRVKTCRIEWCSSDRRLCLAMSPYRLVCDSVLKHLCIDRWRARSSQASWIQMTKSKCRARSDMPESTGVRTCTCTVGQVILTLFVHV